MSAPYQEDPKVAALARIYGIDPEPVRLYLSRVGGAIDDLGLVFGARYSVLRSFQASDSGAVQKGEKLHFLGAIRGVSQLFFPYAAELELCFERSRGDVFRLVFDQDGHNAKQAGADSPVVDLRHPRDVQTYFKPMRFDFSKRTKQLLAARAVIQHHYANPAPAPQTSET